MTTGRERYLLERCLRLEARIAQLEGRATESPPPQPPVLAERAMAPLPSLRLAPPVRRIERTATAGEIAHLRDLRRRGMGYTAISRVTPFSAATARRYTHDVLMEREAGAP